MTPEDCNEYRKKYLDMTSEELSDWHSRLWKEHRAQRHFDLDAAGRFFSGIGEDCHVTELGGWDGELAGLMLARYPNILRWTNYEVCREAREHSVCSDNRYVVSGGVPSVTEGACGVLVASHVLEHMHSSEIVLALGRLLPACNHFYVDVPPPHGLHNSTSFHIVGDALPIIRRCLDAWEEVGCTARWYKKI